MNKINVAVECNIEHKASIYALVTSIKANKNKKSRYCIYILTSGTPADNWDKLTYLSDDMTEICIIEKTIEELKGIGKVIYLQWNTLVMGDLSQLYNIDLEEKSFAVTGNYPEKSYNIPVETVNYNSSVLLIDTDRFSASDDYKELSVFYNYGYEEFVRNNTKISNNKLNIAQKDYDRIKSWALILRLDKNNSPDKYFDGPLSELWMKYYTMSPMGDVSISRSAYVETIGSMNVDVDNSVPVLMSVEDKTVAYTISTILALKENMNDKRQLDVRLVYNQLSNTHKDMLFDLVCQKVNIILYNIQEYYNNYKKASIELLTSLIFTEYDKAVYIGKGMLIQSDIGKLYDFDIDDYWIGALEYTDIIQEDDKSSKDIYFREMQYLDTELMLINIKEWNQNTLTEKAYSLLNDNNYSKYTTQDIINLICIKKAMNIPSIIGISKYTGQEERYKELVEQYILKYPWGEQLKVELASYENGEDDKMKEILQKVKKLEETNAKLKERNRELTSENDTLCEERDRYLYEILETRRSVTYKIGRLITYLPRKLRGKK